MTAHVTSPLRRPTRATIGALLAASVLLFAGSSAAGASAADAPKGAGTEDSPLTGRAWVWPVREFRVDRPFEAPAHRYGPGHRGIDLRLAGTPELLAPAAGTVAFVGQVAGRGVLTIDHGDGLVTTLEPAESELLPGIAVARAAVVGTVAVGGHVDAGVVHFGVRLDGEYINPLQLLGGVPRAVLLPCC